MFWCVGMERQMCTFLAFRYSPTCEAYWRLSPWMFWLKIIPSTLLVRHILLMAFVSMLGLLFTTVRQPLLSKKSSIRA
ncbi:hypothetical protein O181_031668 [Austropuccinia psidii MF-1]|uniref:Uncharacterized protein n=1 Tax=Austropuccinia psidii MF-1 TaxID=1389203 RepID=A0A9Q3D058_9BASI|nr:hypothetical protein [Austropuccinia psidii MF-1]